MAKPPRHFEEGDTAREGTTREEVTQRVRSPGLVTVSCLTGPKGFPFRTVLIGLLLSQYVRKETNLSSAWEVLFFGLSKASKRLLDVPLDDLRIPHGASQEEIDRIAELQYRMSKRVYRSWESMTERLALGALIWSFGRDIGWLLRTREERTGERPPTRTPS